MRTSFAFLAATAAFASLFAMPAHAGFVNKTHTQNAATSCTLSIPSIDTKARPKATGFRNEGTTNVFVICGFDLDSTDPGYNNIELRLASFDGAAHTFNCTAMSRYADEQAGQYLTKSVTTAANGVAAPFTVDDTDPETYDLYPWGQSITCTLPPGVAILTLWSNHDDEDSVP
ncbi:hypothetical protein FNZ56_09205 [Pseudoluteimonas lycopersici]|uniref:Spore coat protein U domain-containing protein n=1 Tax=Pseudoluteimonas lycopersici TaxID=1324796 RepID=A0A516V6A0_9GAMM|nr:hypothetical protein [Lysobacter lycopersici]QDQ74043.1 hypothetical protein FNZ56_09205 [Lysobacter lycopersici]